MTLQEEKEMSTLSSIVGKIVGINTFLGNYYFDVDFDCEGDWLAKCSLSPGDLSFVLERFEKYVRVTGKVQQNIRGDVIVDTVKIEDVGVNTGEVE
jgi:hypothetical protein